MSFDDAIVDQEPEDEVFVTGAMRLHPRAISGDQLRRFEGYMSEIFAAFGMDMDSPE